MITKYGLNIYEGALHAMSLALLGIPALAVSYQQNNIYGAKTCGFDNIRGDAPCKGIIVNGECTDVNNTGVCGFCYGATGDRTEPKMNAWTFRSISDVYSEDSVIDKRCPDLGHPWAWNDYKPILGENAWSNLIGMLQTAVVRFGGINNVPTDDFSVTNAINFLPSLQKMIVPGIGSIFYCPHNTLKSPTYDYGFEVSTENNASLLSGLKALRRFLLARSFRLDLIPQIESLIRDITSYLKAAYDPSVGYFRQGGMVQGGTYQWATGATEFAVDCQTWVMSVLGRTQVDQWFGAGSADRIWLQTKKFGGYKFDGSSGSVVGLGYSMNQESQAYSGEWTLGAINMLRVFAKETGIQKYTEEAQHLRRQLDRGLVGNFSINGRDVQAVKYVNDRYYIPFGWWANPFPNIASTAWTLFVDANFNPFTLGGSYSPPQ